MKIKISNNTDIVGIQLTCNEFIKKFNELETLLLSDDKRYLVLYEEKNAFPWSIGQYKEIFWCIPTSEIDFIWSEEDGWHIASGVGVIGRVTLDEDPDPEEYNRIRDAVAEYNKKFEMYERFEEAFAEYVLFNTQSDEHIFRIWKSLQKWVTVEDEDVAADNRVCLVTYLEEDWNAWFMSIINREFKYMNLTQIVWNSWLER